MLEVQEELIDKITEVFHLTLKGQKPNFVELPEDCPDNEIKQVVIYVNRFIAEYNELADFMYSLAKGELDYEAPKGKMRVLQSFKSLQASLRHLTWKTQQIANGNFNHSVDFMGDFSTAFNRMTHMRDNLDYPFYFDMKAGGYLNEKAYDALLREIDLIGKMFVVREEYFVKYAFDDAEHIIKTKFKKSFEAEDVVGSYKKRLEALLRQARKWFKGEVREMWKIIKTLEKC